MRISFCIQLTTQIRRMSSPLLVSLILITMAKFSLRIFRKWLLNISVARRHFQRVEVEGSLRFAIDILRNRLNIRRSRDNQRRGERGGADSARSSQDLEEREDIEIVTEMLTELGLSGPPSQQAAQIARQMEDSELRTEGLRSRLSKTEKERTAAERELRERNQTISELRAELRGARRRRQ